MAAALAPLLSLAGLGLYFLLTLRFAIWRRVPWEFLALSAAGGALGLYQLVSAPGVGTGTSAVLSVGITAFAFWFVLSFSMYGPREDRPRKGDPFPDFALPTSEGGRFARADAGARRLLVLCYRGAW